MSQCIGNSESGRSANFKWDGAEGPYTGDSEQRCMGPADMCLGVTRYVVGVI